MNQAFQGILATLWPYRPAYWLLLIMLPLVWYLFASPEEALKLLQIESNPGNITILKWQVSASLLLFGIVVAHLLTVSYCSTLKLHSRYRVIKLKLGEYAKVNQHNDYNIKITLEKVSRESLPADYITIDSAEDNLIETESATLSFYPSQMYCGRRVKKLEDFNTIAEETFILPVNKNLEAEESVYSYHIKNSIDKVMFFYCSVDHVNLEAKEAEISVYNLTAPKPNS